MAAMSAWARSVSSTRKAMLPRELVEELIRGFGAASRHVGVSFPNTLERLSIILTLPFQVIGQDVVQGVSRAFAATPREFLEFRQPLGLQGHGVHDPDQYPTTPGLVLTGRAVAAVYSPFAVRRIRTRRGDGRRLRIACAPVFRLV